MSGKRYSPPPPPKGEGLEDPKFAGDLTPEQWAEVLRVEREEDPNEGYDANEVIEWLKSRRTANPKPRPQLRRFE
jgi:hypothetical protein